MQLAGFAPHVQFGAAAVVAIVAMVVLRRSAGRKQRDTSTNPDVNLDIGATVTVDAWRDGRARVQYRGADWDVGSRTASATMRTCIR